MRPFILTLCIVMLCSGCAEPPEPCQHNWKIIRETSTRPLGQISGLRGPDAKEILERAMFGVTTILWECTNCQGIRTKEMLGGS